MTRLVPIVMAALILSAAATAHAIPITVHEKKQVPVVREVVMHKNIAGDPMPTTALERGFKTITVERVEHVAPVDEDDDGIADSEDDCVFCEPIYVRSSGTGGYSGDGTSSDSVDGYWGAGCPASMWAESGPAGYAAYNPSSGATGCYQILPSTAAAHNCDLSYPSGQDACAAAICETQGSAAWAASGASPC